MLGLNAEKGCPWQIVTHDRPLVVQNVAELFSYHGGSGVTLLLQAVILPGAPRRALLDRRREQVHEVADGEGDLPLRLHRPRGEGEHPFLHATATCERAHNALARAPRGLFMFVNVWCAWALHPKAASHSGCFFSVGVRAHIMRGRTSQRMLLEMSFRLP